MAKSCGLPPSRLVKLRLKELAGVAAVLRAAGEILPVAPWLQVIANLLSSLRPLERESRRDKKPPIEYVDFSPATISLYARGCGLECTDLEIRAAYAETKAWRARMAARTGRPHRLMMDMDVIGEKLGVTDEVRTEARAWNIGTMNGSSAARAQARRERDRQHKQVKRRIEGVVSRKDYEAKSLSKTKPWEAEGISRRTWYRRRAGHEVMAQVRRGTSASEAMDFSGTSASEAMNNTGSAFLFVTDETIQDPRVRIGIRRGGLADMAEQLIKDQFGNYPYRPGGRRERSGIPMLAQHFSGKIDLAVEWSNLGRAGTCQT